MFLKITCFAVTFYFSEWMAKKEQSNEQCPRSQLADQVDLKCLMNTEGT